MLENLSVENRQELAFQIVVALRDTLSIAKKSAIKPTYESAINIINDLSPELYEEISAALPFKNLSEEARFFQSKAELQSLSSEVRVTAIQLIDLEMAELEELLRSAAGIDAEKKRLVKHRILSLVGIKESLRPRRISENRYLQRDFSMVDRTDFGTSLINQNDFVADFRLKANSFLRIRLLHPDGIEHVTGADLIYEQHDVALELIRVMFLQYKIWEDGVLYFSQARNLETQLRRMKSLLCDQGYCQQPQSLNGQFDFRFPYCSAFLRPTDKVSISNSKLISSGIHIPICAALSWRDRGDVSINKSEIRTATLTHEIFEHLFNKSFVGSRWLRESELETFYRDNGILDPEESIKIYAREIIENTSDNPF
jgi:hypothetical protein